ncbi:MAG: hypothetical protein K0S32_94 [Bacteroidetes bacterium]|jgi:hypothetical protein|nr:hypothetical protein [Bacteroidota bacterium]
MRLLTYLGIGILCFGIHSFTNAPTEAMSLKDALAKGLVKLNVTGLGGHSGECIEAGFQNVSAKKVSVKIEPGLVFKPEDPGMQDILVVKEQIIVLNGKASKKSNLLGFCCISSNRSPKKGTKFTVAKEVDPKLVDIARHINKNKYSEDAMQNAVWSVSDNQEVSEIYDEVPETVKPLREEVCRLTGQKNDWFNRQVNRSIDEEGYIQSEPTKIDGNLVIDIDKPTSIYQTVYKENGEVAWAPEKALDINFTGKISMKFNITIRGWAKGKYYVKITRPGKELLKQDFTV